MESSAIDGHCHCGAVRYRISAAPKWCGHCHCSDCRRHCGSAVATFVGVDRAQFRVTTGEMQAYRSSPGVRRFFCAACGTPMAYESDQLPDEIHILLGTLARPENFPARLEVFCRERLPWLKLAVDGPSFDALPG